MIKSSSVSSCFSLDKIRPSCSILLTTLFVSSKIRSTTVVASTYFKFDSFRSYWIFSTSLSFSFSIAVVSVSSVSL
ncbi:hypothetical protein Hanom_Chr12g01134881 [Helianthus anomalus]